MHVLTDFGTSRCFAPEPMVQQPAFASRGTAGLDFTTEPLVVVDRGGHTWPGASDIPGLGPTTQEINAAEVIWAFFSQARTTVR